MSEFFQNPEDLGGWIKSKKSGDDAATELLDVIKTMYQNINVKDDEQSIFDTCKQVFESKDDEAKSIAEKTLFGVLSKHNITNLRKEAKNMKNIKTAQQSPSSRQRNNWVKGERNKWNRVVDGFNEGTPWRIDRDKFYNFTHYYTDAVTFDEDPTHVYSGEALWRTYVMDKFSSEVQDKNGRWIGGYINNRYYVFPDAGTPANPKVDRMQGNQMELAPGERTRKPRPHQYSTERRLEEARGHKTTDLEAISGKFNSFVKIASNLPEERDDDRVYQIFKDVMDMRESGVDYEKRIEMLSGHYNASITGIAQIEKIASNLLKKHEGIGYAFERISQVAQPSIAPVNIPGKNPVYVQNSQGKVFQIAHESLVDMQGGKVQFKDPETGTMDYGTIVDQQEAEYLDDAFDVQEVAEGEKNIVENEMQTGSSTTESTIEK